MLPLPAAKKGGDAQTAHAEVYRWPLRNGIERSLLQGEHGFRDGLVELGVLTVLVVLNVLVDGIHERVGRVAALVCKFGNRVRLDETPTLQAKCIVSKVVSPFRDPSVRSIRMQPTMPTLARL